jgi:hypothetical protein
MKKIYYLIALMAVAAGFTACHPMNETYKQLDASPTPSPKTLTYTLASADYGLGGSTKLGYFTSAADANTNIPKILNAKFVYGYDNGSNANITYASSLGNITQPDSVAADLKYTLVNKADYLLLPGNTFADFSVAQLLSWLPYKYPNPGVNEQHILTWIFYPTIATTAPQIYPGLSIASTVSGTTTTTLATGSFAYINGAWVQDYFVTNAQYASIGRGQYNQFTSADDATLVSQLNGILKTDAGVMATATTGSTQYVSFNYYSAAKVTAQRILAMVYNGTNWTHTPASATLTYVKSNGTWVPDPTIFYTAVQKDWTYIGTLAPAALANATTDAISNYAKYGDFTTSSTSLYYWSPAQIDAAMIAILKYEFPSAKVGIPYHINYLLYTGSAVPASSTFKFDGTNWVKQ